MKAKDVKSSHTLSLVRCFDAIGALVAAACTANDTTIDVVCVICQHAEAGPPSRLSILARNERLPRATPRDFNRLVSGPAVARRDQLDLACSDISCTEYLRPRARTLASDQGNLTFLSSTCHGTVLTDPHSHSPRRQRGGAPCRNVCTTTSQPSLLPQPTCPSTPPLSP